MKNKFILDVRDGDPPPFKVIKKEKKQGSKIDPLKKAASDKKK